MTPFVGRNFNVTRAGIHADGLLKDEEIYNIMAIPDEERERCEIYVNLPQETLKFYDKLWTQLGV